MNFSIKNMTIKQKLIATAGLSLLTVALLVGNTFISLTHLATLQDDGYVRAKNAIDVSEGSGMGAKMYLITADAVINQDLEETAKLWKTIKEEWTEDSANIIRMADTPEETKWAAESKSAGDEFIRLFENELLPLLKSNGSGVIKQIGDIDGKMDGQIGVISERLTSLATSMQKEAEEADIEFDSTRTHAIWTSIIGGMLSIIAVLMMSILTTRSIIGSTNKFVMTITSIEQTQDFSKKVNLDTQDELGQIAKAFDNMMTGLHSTLTNTNAVMDAVAATLVFA